MQYVDLTPRWAEILPTWLMMYRQAIQGNCTDPKLVEANAKKEFQRMAEGADKFNDLIRWMRGEGWTDNTIDSALHIGRNLQETDRHTIKESDDA